MWILHSWKILFILTVCSCALQSGTGEGIYYVTPSEDVQCPGEPCHTLSRYAANHTFYSASNAVFRFLPGDHVMNDSGNVMSVDTFNLSWIGDSIFTYHNSTFLDIPEPSSRIVCKDQVVFYFQNVTDLLVANLVFSNCTGSGNTLFFRTVRNLHIHSIIVMNSSGYGLSAKNILGDSVIHGSTFLMNGNSFDYGGNVLIEYNDDVDTVNCSTTETFTLSVIASNILFGHCQLNTLSTVTPTAGMTLMFLQSCYSMEVFVQDVFLYGNVASGLGQFGGNMLLILKGPASTSVFIENSFFGFGNAATGGGLTILQPYVQDCNRPPGQNKASIVHVSNTVFMGNSAMWGGGIGIHLQGGCTDTLLVYITSTNFTRNRAEETGGHVDISYGLDPVHYFTAIIRESYFVQGKAKGGGAIHVEPIIFSSPLPDVTIEERIPLPVFDIAESHIVNNTAVYGGGIHVDSEQNVYGSEIHIRNVRFSNNSAGIYGGGLHIQQYKPDCQPAPAHNQNIVYVSNTVFLWNSAMSGGGVELFLGEACTNTTVYITNSIFSKNTAEMYGGHIDLNYMFDPHITKSSAVMKDCNFEYGTAEEGGGIRVYFHKSSSVQNIVKVNNDLYITNSIFSKNTAEKYGGHIGLNYEFDPHSTISSTIVKDCHFEYGTAEGGGGINVFLHNSSSAQNKARVSVNQDPAPLLQIVGSHLVSNIAQQTGGGGMMVVFASKCHDFHIFIDNVNFTKNSALHGGNIFILDSYSAGRNYVTIARCSVELGSARAGAGMMVHTQSSPCSELVFDATCELDSITITNTVFQHNTAHSYAGGLGVVLNHSCCAVDVHILNTTFLNNSVGNHAAEWVDINGTQVYSQGPQTGGNIAIQETGTLYTTNYIRIEDSVIEGGSAEQTGGLFVKHIPWIPTNTTSNCIDEEPIESEFLLIKNTSFIENISISKEGTSFEMTMDLNELYPHLLSSKERSVLKSVMVESCVIYGKYSGFSNVRILGAERTQNPPLLYNVTFINTSFSGYQEPGHNHEPRMLMKGMGLVYVHKATFNDCEFLESGTDGALIALGSDLYFQGNVTFRGNTATNGGALSLCAESIMFLKPHTHIKFIHNHASRSGGALYIEQRCSLAINRQCFYQFGVVPGIYLTHSVAELDLHVELENNTAGYAGSALYGGDVDYCILLNDPRTDNYFDIIFTGQNNSQDTTAISSDPRSICFCINNRPECDTRVIHTAILPGASFNISAVVVGQKKGTVPADVHAWFLGSSNATFDELQYSQAVGNSCTILTYTIFSSQSSEAVNLTIEQLQLTTKHTLIPYPPSVVIKLLPCPTGFALSQSPVKCGCLHQLSKRVTCDITTQTIIRPPSIWIGYLPSSGVIIHNNCPFDYCKHETIALQLNDADVQCAFSRSGILCGACPPGLSLALGSSRCLECSNRYVALLIAFIVAGFALVFLISAWDLTVAEGTLNGLIFYANILHTNRAIFFPGGESNILTVFIAWINLDLGIETCFYDGMDTYAKAWLQFVFPVYIWLIVGIMIITSEYSITAARLFRRNAVKVLATIILLSFAKLQRTIIIGLSFTYLEYLDKQDEAVWLYDGNVKYLHGKSIPLFIASVVALVVFVAPYTIIILLTQCLQRKTDYAVLAWVRRLKPFFDAYTGPYKDKYRFWTGLLLLARTILFLIFALNVLEPTLNLLTIIIGSVCFLALSPDVYKKRTLTLLERSFFVNLSVTSAATLYSMFTEGYMSVIANISIGIAFTTFIGIFVYHSWKCVTTTKPWKGLTEWFHCRQTGSCTTDHELVNVVTTDSSDGEQNDHTHSEVRPLVLVFRGTGEHREAVLIHEDSDSEDPLLPQ